MADGQDQENVLDSSGNAGRDDDRKLFVGGLSKETTEQDLRDHFSQFGDIVHANVKTDPQTGRSRGFAFVIFQSPESIEKVTAVQNHIINGKTVDPKKAKARQGKIFIGGVSPETTDEEITGFFGQFGNIAEVEFPFDKLKNQRKGFCFITFDSEAAVTELLKTPKQILGGKEVDVKRATARPDMGGPMRGSPQHGARGDRGGFSGPRAYGQGWGGAAGYGGYNPGGFGGGFSGGYGGGPGFGGGGGWGYNNYDYSGYGADGFQGGKQRGAGRQNQRPY